MSNRLANETSPYLLQHASNPVDWYPWGEEAIEEARRTDRPIFLSIGYSACHWCHVMERESFEHPEIARALNENFIPVKVDREERPDLDQIYMNAVQMLTGHGGWPMSVFLTPELKPFYGGTYWPPRASRGMPGFDQVIAAVNDAWRNRRDQALMAADQLTAELRNIGQPPSMHEPVLSIEIIDAAVAQLKRAFDDSFGGFGRAPKFPHPMDLQLLLRAAHRSGQTAPLEMVQLTLDRMAAGGIYDHLGGGFARYSVDARWLVPHFEKMLYDNALLAGTYLDAYMVTGNRHYSQVVREVLTYIRRDMTDPGGAFYSAEDADSEGQEGLFYTWTPEELEEVLGKERADTFARVYDVTDVGNFEGRSILNLRKSIDERAGILQRDSDELASDLADSRQQLFKAREKRVRPGRDDKVIVSWNGLMIEAMARAGAVLSEADYIESAAAAASFIFQHMRREDGRLLHTWRDGTAKLDAYLDDYSALANGLVSLYEATFNERWIDEATQLLDTVIARFSDPQGGFFFTANDHEKLITRTKELTDSSTPSGNSLAATALLRLGKLLGRSDYIEVAEDTLVSAESIMRRAPLAAGQMLVALDLYLGPTYELALIGDLSCSKTKAAINLLQRSYLPTSVTAARDATSTERAGTRSSQLDALFEGKKAPNGGPVLHVCQDYTCQEPAEGLDAIESQLEELASRVAS